MEDKEYTETAPGEVVYIPRSAREAFRRPAFAYTALCPDPTLRPEQKGMKKKTKG